MKKNTTGTTEVAETTDPVASQLGVARLRLGWTIEEASARTRLHLNVIRRLEAGDYDKFPSIAYARGRYFVGKRKADVISEQGFGDMRRRRQLDQGTFYRRSRAKKNI